MSGIGDGQPFSPWIEQLIVRKSGLVRDDYLAQSHAGVHACLAGGVTTIADCCYADTVAEAAIAQGLRAIVYLEAFSDQGDPGPRMADGLDGMPGSELVRPGISPHAPYTVTLSTTRRWSGWPASAGCRSQRTCWSRSASTCTSTTWPACSGPTRCAIHGVFMTAEDIALLAELDVPVVHCPRSNALLGCGMAPVPELLAQGLRVGLGTDSPASALTFDMWDEMRCAIMLARAGAARPDAMTADRVLELATLDGARAIGLADVIGSLTPGKAADLTVLDLLGSPFLPWDDPVVATVFGGTPERVALTMVNGQIRYDRAHPAAANAGRRGCAQRCWPRQHPLPSTKCCSNAYDAPRSRCSSSWR